MITERFPARRRPAASSIVVPTSLVVALLSAAATSASHGQTPRASALDATLAKRFDAYLQPYVAMNDFAGTVLVARKGTVVFEHSYGLANRETGTPHDANTKFRIGSVSKELTAAGILLLVDRGLVDLDAPVDRYVPGMPNGAQANVRQLLTHAAGMARDIPDQRTYSTVPHTTADLLATAAKTTPVGAPNAQFVYSNIDYLLLAAIIEKASGQSYGHFLDSALFEPLGMTSTGVDSTQLVLPRRASGYQTGVGTTVLNARFEDMSNQLGYGSVYSTAGDLLRWEEAWNRNPILSTQSWRAIFTDYGHHYGFGVSLREQGGHKIVGHDGSVSGYNSFVRRFPDDSVVVIYLSNVESGVLSALQEHLAELVFGDKAPPSARRPAPVPVPTTTLRRYAGAYQVAPGFVLEVREAGGQLELRGPDGWWFALTPLSSTHFLYRHLFADVTFAVDTGGQVSGLTWKDLSGAYPSKKIR